MKTYIVKYRYDYDMYDDEDRLVEVQATNAAQVALAVITKLDYGGIITLTIFGEL